MTPINSFTLSPKETLLLIIDIQERLASTMNQDYLYRVCDQIHLLTQLSKELKIPILLTEQYPEGLGPTTKTIKESLKNIPHENLSKITFGCCEDPSFNNKLKAFGRKKVIVVGMETHVCVYLTCLGLIKQGYHPHVASDAVISRGASYYKSGLDLLRQSGSVVTNTETLLFQLMGQSGTPTFKKTSTLLKETLSRRNEI